MRLDGPTYARARPDVWETFLRSPEAAQNPDMTRVRFYVLAAFCAYEDHWTPEEVERRVLRFLGD